MNEFLIALIFSRATTEPSRRKTDKGKRQRSGSLLDHVRQFYDFAWNGGLFRLDDENDSVNFGDLSVSPPPSGERESRGSPFEAVLSSFENEKLASPFSNIPI